MKALGYCIPIHDASTVQINAAAYADDLVLYSEAHNNMECMLFLLSQFCEHAKMKINAEKCVSFSKAWSLLKKYKAGRDPKPFYIRTELGDEEIPMEIVAIYLGMRIGFNNYENTKHGQAVLASMMEDANNIGKSKLRIVQKMHALKTFVFPRIDSRMICADLTRTHLDHWDSQIRALVGEWSGIRNIQVEHFRMSWRDGGFLFHSLRDRQNTLVIRTALEMLTSPDEITRNLMKQFETEQAANCGIEWKEREPCQTDGFLNWAPTFDQQKLNPGKPTKSIFPRAFQAHQEDDVSCWVEKAQQFLTHLIAESFVESKISRRAMWIKQSVCRVMYR
jgi:hypothetical protein